MGVQINGSEGNVIATKGTYSGNVTIGGTLTYEDVTNIDSVGLVTARTGIEIGARPGVAASISVDGNAIFSGITTIGSHMAVGGVTPETFGGGHVTLEVAGSTTSQGGVFKTATSDSAGTGSSGTEMILFTDSAKGSVNVVSSDPLTFSTANTERARITSAGLVGIGTVSPAHALDIQGSSASFTKIALSNQTMNTSKYEIIFGDAGQVNHVVPASREFTIATGGTTERFRIQANGDANVGSALSTSGLRYFDVSNTSNAADTHGSIVRLITSNAANTGTTSVDMVKYKNGNFYISNNESSGTTNFSNGGSTRVTIDSSGNLKFNSNFGSVQTAYGVRAWVFINNTTGSMTPYTDGSGGVTSVDDLGAGAGRVNFSITMPNTAFAIVSGHRRSGTYDMTNVGFSNATTSFRFDSFSNGGNSNADLEAYSFVIVR